MFAAPGLKKLWHHQRGSALVEFALVAPLLLLLIFGSLEFGRVFNAWIVVANAAREGARLAALGRSAPEVESHVRQALGAFAPGSLTVATENTQGIQGEPVTVTVTVGVPLVTPLVAAFFPTNPYPVQSAATMRLE